MIAVYAICHVETGKTAEFEAVAKTLIKASLKDQGCLSYVCGPVQGKENIYTFVEQWRSQEDLELHAEQSHFKQAADKFAGLLSRPIEINVVNTL